MDPIGTIRHIIVVQLENLSTLGALIVGNWAFLMFVPKIMKGIPLPVEWKEAIMLGAKSMGENTIFQLMANVPRLTP